MLALNQEVQEDVPYECIGHIIVSASVVEENMGLFGRVQPASRPGCPVFDALVVSVALTFFSFFFVGRVQKANAIFPPDHCETAPFFVSVYLCFNLVYNVVLIVILKYGR